MSNGFFKVSSERVKLFDEKFANLKPEKTTQGTDRTWPVDIKSETDTKDLYVYQIKHEDLWYNIENTRFLSQKEKLEFQKKRLLDARKDIDDLEDFLLHNPSYGDQTTKEITASIRAEGVRDPLIISEDGVVWNGNRRLSVVKWLLKHEYDSKYEYVPVVRLPSLEYNELKDLEGRLQIKKLYKQDYGTIEIRCRVRQAQDRDKWPMDKIAHSFGDRFKESELKIFVEEINVIDEYLRRVNREKDYEYIYTKGGKKKGGAEIFITATSAIRREEKILKNNQTELNKIKTLYFQQVHQPNVSHDTVRIFRDIMTDKQSRTEFLQNSDTYKNHSKLTKTLVKGKDGKNIEQTFHVDQLRKEENNRIATQPFLGAKAKDPKKFVENALRELNRIELSRVPKNNKVFKDTLQKIREKLEKLEKESRKK